MEVKLFSTPSCLFSKMAKEYFAEHEVSFVEYDVAKDRARREEMIERSGQLGVPVIIVGNELVIGYDRKRLDELLFAGD